MPVHAMHHFNLRAPADELRVLRDFYRDVLGFTEGPRPPFKSKGYWLYVDGLPLLHLTESPSGDSLGDVPNRKSAFDHIALRCSNLDEIVARLRAHGVPFVMDEVPAVKQIQLFLNDPSGVGVELNFERESLT